MVVVFEACRIKGVTPLRAAEAGQCFSALALGHVQNACYMPVASLYTTQNTVASLA